MSQGLATEHGASGRSTLRVPDPAPGVSRGSAMSTTLPPAGPVESLPPAEKVKTFPTTPGVYLMKDAQAKVLYVGKAKNLRNRASHYFTKAAAEDPRTADLVK